MIRNVILMATSGLVLFSKEFVNSVAQVSRILFLFKLMMIATFNWFTLNSNDRILTTNNWDDGFIH